MKRGVNRDSGFGIRGSGALPLAILLLGAIPARAQQPQRSLAIKNFVADIVVGADGVVDVTENITAQFHGQWNGVQRLIPVEYRTPQGFNWTLRLNVLGATDQAGNPLRIETSRERHYLKVKMWVPGARDVTRTVVLHYRTDNGLRFFEDHDEIYWNVTGDEWDVPIEAASARIQLPPAATGLRAISFNGAYGSTAHDAKVITEGNTIRVTMPKSLGFHEGLTAVVGWNKGAVPEPTRTDEALDFAESNWPLAIPALVLLGMFVLWHRVGRDPASLPVSVQYEPPAGLTPAEAGTLMDESVDMRDITATMVDLAVGGHLRIEEREEKVLLGLFKNREYVFHRTQPAAGARALISHEQSVLNGIFAGGETEVRLSDLENEFYRNLPGIRDGVYRRLHERGLQHTRPDAVKNRWIGAAVVLGLLVAYGGATFGARHNMQPFPFVLAGLVSGLIIALFARVMPARTTAGARMLEKVRGFEEFLTRVDGDRFARIVKTPEMFERFLPFAMAFGVEQKWARAFRDIYRTPPNWYVGTNPMAFNASTFSSSLSDLSGRAGKSMSSSPRSSGGSGFSGGSSGGGSGGGGGGGF